MMSTDDLITIIEGHLARTGTPPTVFGWNAVKDGNLMNDLKKGNRSPSLKTVQKILAYIDTVSKKQFKKQSRRSPHLNGA